MPGTAEISRLESALDQAATRARMAAAAGRWEEASRASAEAQNPSASLASARRTSGPTNIVRRVTGVRG